MFCSIKDKILLYNDIQAYSARCLSCNSLNHETKNCILVHYVPDKEKIIKQFTFPQIQDRNLKFVRNNYFKKKKILILKTNRPSFLRKSTIKSNAPDFTESDESDSDTNIEFKRSKTKEFIRPKHEIIPSPKIIAKPKPRMSFQVFNVKNKKIDEFFLSSQHKRVSNINKDFKHPPLGKILKLETISSAQSLTNFPKKKESIRNSLVSRKKKQGQFHSVEVDNHLDVYEKIEEFVSYFPHNNFVNVMMHINELNEKKKIIEGLNIKKLKLYSFNVSARIKMLSQNQINIDSNRNSINFTFFKKKSNYNKKNTILANNLFKDRSTLFSKRKFSLRNVMQLLRDKKLQK